MSPQSPNTIVLIHGLWMTPLSWEHWIERYQTPATGDRAGVARNGR